MNKQSARKRRGARLRAKAKRMRCIRLCVHKTPRHIYAQVIDATGKVITQASTLDKSLRGKTGGNVEAAKTVGILIAERAKAVQVTDVVFDRSGFRFHGRIQALAEAAREEGMKF